MTAHGWIMATVLAIAPLEAAATGITLCRNRQGVVLSADTKSSDSPAPELKLFRLSEHAVVAVAGLTLAEWSQGTIFYRYDLEQVLGLVARKLDPRTSLDAFAEAIRADLTTALERVAEAPLYRAEMERRPSAVILYLVGNHKKLVEAQRVEATVRNGQVRVTVLKFQQTLPPRLLVDAVGIATQEQFDDLNRTVDRLQPKLRAAAHRSLTELANLCSIYLALRAQKDPTIAMPWTEALVRPNTIEMRGWGRPARAPPPQRPP